MMYAVAQREFHVGVCGGLETSTLVRSLDSKWSNGPLDSVLKQKARSLIVAEKGTWLGLAEGHVDYGGWGWDARLHRDRRVLGSPTAATDGDTGGADRQQSDAPKDCEPKRRCCAARRRRLSFCLLLHYRASASRGELTIGGARDEVKVMAKDRRPVDGVLPRAIGVKPAHLDPEREPPPGRRDHVALVHPYHQCLGAG